MTCEKLRGPIKVSIQTLGCALIALVGSQAWGQFTTVLNIPPNPDIGDNESIGSGTQVNLSAGGAIGNSVDAVGTEVNVFGGSVGSNFEVSMISAVNIFDGTVGGGLQLDGGSTVTISGGSVGTSLAAMFSTVNISGGTVGIGLTALNSTLNLSGGSVGVFVSARDSVVNISGGSVGSFFSAREGSDVHFSGGSMGDGFDFDASAVFISGDDFRLDDVPVSGLVDVPPESLLSGTLADGTPFAFTRTDNDFASSAVLNLQTEALPPVGPGLITASTDIVPLGIRQGQSLRVDNGGAVADNFNAGQGSKVDVEPGGSVGDNFEAVGTDVTISGGAVGDNFDAFLGSVVNITGGTIGNAFTAFSGSEVNIFGGSVGGTFSINGGVANISAGLVGDGFCDNIDVRGGILNITGGSVGDEPCDSVSLFEGGTVNASGGTVGGGISPRSGTTVNISGGSFGGEIFGPIDSMVTISGGEFRLDDVPVVVLGSTNIPTGSVLSGTLADGTPFAFVTGRMTLVAASVPPVGPALITASTDVVPLGIRQGQTLLVNDSGVVADNFNAGLGSTVVVEAGGSVGDNLEAVGANVTISGGTVGQHMDAFFGSTVDISGGSVGGSFNVRTGSTVNITGGAVAGIIAHTGSTTNISGGMVNMSGPLQANIGSTVNISADAVVGFFNGSGTVNMSGGSVDVGFNAGNNSVVNLSGGSVSGRARVMGGTVNMSGGAIEGTLEAANSLSEVNLIGRQFLLDSLDISDTLSPNVPFTIVDRDVTLSGLLEDGSPFSFDLNSTFMTGEDFFLPSATLTVMLLPLGDFDGDRDVDGFDFLKWQRGELFNPISAADLAHWEANYGSAPPLTAQAAAVPEPHFLGLIMMAAVGLLSSPIRFSRVSDCLRC